MTEEKYWYRAKNDTSTRSYSVDEWGDVRFYDVYMPVASIVIQSFRVERHTAKGAWICDGFHTRWCARDSLRGYAKPTIDEAIDHLRARNNKRIRILKNDLKKSEVLRDGFDKAAASAVEQYEKVKGIYEYD